MANEYSVNKADLLSVANAIRSGANTTESLVFPSGFVSMISNINNQNFSVVAYSSSFPATANENTIGIITTTAITSYAIQATQPSASQGKVWIVTSTASNASFNALKNNTIICYPNQCKQYINGSWVVKTFKIFKSGAWVSTRLYLYASGQSDYNEWSRTGQGFNSTYNTGYIAAPTVTYGSSYLTVKSPQTNGNGHCYRYVDLTGYTTLRAEILAIGGTTANAACDIRIRTSMSGYMDNNNVSSVTPTANSTCSLNVSSLNGKYYVCIRVYSNRSVQIKNLWLE